MSYKSIRPGEVFEFRLESATEQNDNVAKKRKKKTKKQKRRRKGLSRWRRRQQRIKSTDIFGFKLFFYFLSADCLFPAETHRYSTDMIRFGSSLSCISVSRGKKKHVAGCGPTRCQRIRCLISCLFNESEKSFIHGIMIAVHVIKVY